MFGFWGCASKKTDGPGKAAAESVGAAQAASCAVVLAVSGMTWASGCPPRVARALESVEGVEKVEVNYDTKEAQISGAKVLCNEPSVLKLTQALDKAGFSGDLKKSDPPF